jgi:hypothetical protein
MRNALLRCTRVTLQIGFRAAGIGLAVGSSDRRFKTESRQEPVSETSSAAM